VELLLAGKVHHTAVADASGEFVMIPEPLPPGEYELSLRGRQSDGTTSMSEKSIAVAVGARNAPRTQLATAPKVVEPAPAFAAQVPILPASTVAVEAEGGGKLRAHGSFPVGAAVRLYINDAYVASATASQDGVVVFAIESGMVAGKYRARFEQFNFATGRIEARAEVTFTAEGPTSSPAATTTSVISPAVPQRSGGEFTTEVDAFQTTGSLARSPEGTTTVHQVAGAKNASAETPSLARKSLAASVPSNDAHIVLVPRIETAIVVQGDNLWHISRSAYGRGVQYPKIYEANQDQIRDPKLIYPGQVFVLPRTLLVE
jgi:nucleoid-associated protein YgaU